VAQRERIVSGEFGSLPFDMPVLEDANSVQMAIMQVMQMVMMRRIDNKTAGIMLYGLQTAVVNAKNVRFEALRKTDVVIDRDTVHLTAMDGPQWFEEDFEEEEEVDEEDGEELDEEDGEEGSEEEDEAEVKPEKVKPEEVEAQKEEVGAEAVAGAPAAARKPVQGTGEDLRKRLAMRVGENPVDAMKRLMGTVDKMERSG
jgi:hypothetical protein